MINKFDLNIICRNSFSDDSCLLAKHEGNSTSTQSSDGSVAIDDRRDPPTTRLRDPDGDGPYLEGTLPTAKYARLEDSDREMQFLETESISQNVGGSLEVFNSTSFPAPLRNDIECSEDFPPPSTSFPAPLRNDIECMQDFPPPSTSFPIPLRNDSVECIQDFPDPSSSFPIPLRNDVECIQDSSDDPATSFPVPFRNDSVECIQDQDFPDPSNTSSTVVISDSSNSIHSLSYCKNSIQSTGIVTIKID